MWQPFKGRPNSVKSRITNFGRLISNHVDCIAKTPLGLVPHTEESVLNVELPLLLPFPQGSEVVARSHLVAPGCLRSLSSGFRAKDY